MEQFITIGEIINSHGVHGELKILPLTDDLKRFRKLKKVYIDNNEKMVSWCKLQSDKVILKIEGIDTINDAIKYKTKLLKVQRKDAVKLSEGRYYEADIIDCNVEDENGVYLGKINEIIHTGSNDVYWIKGEKELLIPALRSVVIKMDVENSKIIIKPVDQWQ
ncbi:ribosome maturation factor RimM [Clostridium sp. JN-9]|uniref:ribosome maturation factor RimM n=1 Tax=Clostridium sp. JN-9 TaxID=2507159 RepID=UPI000FFE1B0D|nr:ribosome maturation factor RimM [Clostridium sp. JN-9]QAT40178.1 16S rRNA processing protein RimM [Clostridium sp. JN-9]